jgi:voltage-gated potassium channel
MHVAIERLLRALVLVVVVTLAAGAAYYRLGQGQWSFGASLYMAIITISTVGFAELPGLEQTPGARVLTAFVILGGVGTIAYFQSTMTALLVEGTIGHAWRRSRMRAKIDALGGHVVVAGIGSTGRYVVEELWATGTPFVAIDRNHEHLERVSQEACEGRMLYVHGDATEDHTLLAAGIGRAAGVIAALTADRDNLFVTISARSMNPKARIISKVVEAEATAKMTRAGANATVSPNMIGGRRMVSELIRPEVVEFLDQMLRDKNRNLRLEEIAIPADSPWVEHPLREVPFRREANVLVVAVRDEDRSFHYNPGPEYKLLGGMVLVVLGETADVNKARQIVGTR